MPHVLTLVFEEDDVHRIRNCGEALYRQFRDGDLASISIDEVDRAIDRFTVSVRARRSIRRAEAKIQDVLDRHKLHATISRE